MFMALAIAAVVVTMELHCIGAEVEGGARERETSGVKKSGVGRDGKGLQGKVVASSELGERRAFLRTPCPPS